jgi:hypothetical protein
MTEARVCLQCGAALPPDRPADSACPACLFKLALEPSAFGADDVTSAPGITSATSDPTGLMPCSADRPKHIGAYRIQVLGEGGMGLVYLAEQHEPIHRRFRKKLLRRSSWREQKI